jgi:hypothetical protein
MSLSKDLKPREWKAWIALEQEEEKKKLIIGNRK